VKLCYLSRGGSVHDETWLTELRKYFEVVTVFDKSVPRNRHTIDIIQAGPIMPTGSWGHALQTVTGVPLVLMSWGHDVLEPEYQPSTLTYILDFADLLICDSNVVREKLLSLRSTPCPVVQFPWGVDLEQFIPQDSGNTRPKLLTTRRRGLDVVRKAHTAANGAAGLLISVSLEHEKMPKMYHESDLYICASPSDGSSVSLLEAMACGLPVIVYDSAGNREWVQQGVNGWLCEDVNSFAQAIVEAARMGPAERKRMGEANRAVVEARADWHKNFLKLVEVYHGLGK